MYCYFCGKLTPDDSKFCKYCGKDLEREYLKTKPTATSKNSGGKKVLWPTILIIIFFIAVVAAIIITISIRANNESSEDLSNSTSIDYSNYKTLEITEIKASKTEISKNGFTVITLKFNEYSEDIETIWNCTRGTFSNADNSSVTWRAPNRAGSYALSATSKLNGSSDSKVITIIVKEVVDISESEENNDTNITISGDDDYTDTRDQDNYNYAQNTAEENFLNKMSALLDEYNLVTNHIDTYGGSNLIFGEPNTIVFEGSVLARYQELSNKLKSFNCPSNYEDDKKNLIVITEAICFFQNEVVEINKNGSYEAYLNSNNAKNNKIGELFNYSNRMVDIHNNKFH